MQQELIRTNGQRRTDRYKLVEPFAREIKKACSEVKSDYGNKEESMKQKIRNLQTQIEVLKKENINLKSKAKVTKLPESTLKAQPSIDKIK